MDDTRLGAVESQFADIIWKNAPLSSRDLVKLCQQQLEWKKSTTYTVLKKLCDRGIFQNEDGIVTPLVSRQEFHARQSQRFVEETFQGSLPAFISAFASGKKLSPQDVSDIRRMLDEYGKENPL
jgi:BlaI family penicillinase repressor